jgi:hypothetical protein
MRRRLGGYQIFCNCVCVCVTTDVRRDAASDLYAKKLRLACALSQLYAARPDTMPGSRGLVARGVSVSFVWSACGADATTPASQIMAWCLGSADASQRDGVRGSDAHKRHTHARAFTAAAQHRRSSVRQPRHDSCTQSRETDRVREVERCARYSALHPRQSSQYPRQPRVHATHGPHTPASASIESAKSCIPVERSQTWMSVKTLQKLCAHARAAQARRAAVSDGK